MTQTRTRADRWRILWWLMNRSESLQLRWLGTSGIAIMRRLDVLLLETVGRKTGKRRRVGVSFLREPDGRYVIGGGAGGMTRVDWVANLRHQDRAIIWVKRRRVDVVVHELTGAEYDAAKQAAFERWPEIKKYEASGRQIPYFALTR